MIKPSLGPCQSMLSVTVRVRPSGENSCTIISAS